MKSTHANNFPVGKLDCLSIWVMMAHLLNYAIQIESGHKTHKAQTIRFNYAPLFMRPFYFI